MSIKSMLVDEITNEISELDTLELGKDDYVKAVGGVSQLTDRLIKLEELEQKAKETAIEEKKTAIEERKMRDDREDRKVKNRIALLGVIIPSAITAVGATAMFITEGKGVIFPMQASRNFINRIFRSK